ncbi:hypothetical protein [Xanthobacter agilis]|uniref:Uncharacterized protein n=1 Tax=Xanthobacter agilis TaxID=47492 RepID=A0ABU0LEJ9_XANAG|nr:hypothetical protein [Xanthobacter agilis]MDQ0505500.1 hypothetical protein [Xanthobacter agilis]
MSPVSRPDAATPARPMHRPTTALVALKTLSGALALGLMLAGASARPAAAQSEFNANPLDSMMELFGLKDDKEKPEIDYRERAPLVVPPASAEAPLPTPEDAAHQKNPNWPKDPDVARRQREAAAANAPVIRDDPGRPLMPSELNKGRKKILGVIPTEPAPTGTKSDVLLPSQLGSNSWLPGIGGEKEKPLVFNGEPERETLLQPPPGYQTPAPNAPYGVVEKKQEQWKVPTLFDRTN